MFVIRKVKPQNDKEVYYRRTDTRGCHIYAPQPEDAIEFPTRKIAMDRLVHIKRYNEDLEIVTLEEAVLERDMGGNT